MQGLIVRPACDDDIGFLADVMHAATLPGPGRGLFDSVLEGTGTDPVDFNKALLASAASNWGQLDSFLVLQDHERGPIGAVGGFTSDRADLRPLTPEGLRSVAAYLGWSNDTASKFWRRYVGVFGLFGNAPQLAQPGEYVLEYAALRADARGRGLYRHLLSAHSERAQQRGYRTLGHAAMIGNDAVLKALLKFGFHEHSRFDAAYYRGHFPGLIRLVYTL